MPAHKLHPNISKSEKVNALSLKAQLIYTWQLAHTDDFGCLTAEVPDLKILVFPRNRHISEKDIAGGLKELAEIGLIKIYEYAGKPYQQYTRFEDFQTWGKGFHRASYYPPILYREHYSVKKRWGDLKDADFKILKLGCTRVHEGARGCTRDGIQVTGNRQQVTGNRQQLNYITPKVSFLKETIEFFRSEVKDRRKMDYLPSWERDGASLKRYEKLRAGEAGKDLPPAKEMIEFWFTLDKSQKHISFASALSADTINEWRRQHRGD